MKNLFFHFGRRAEAHRPQTSGSCHNCHAPVSTTFCGACGQKAAVHIASAHEFLHHFIGHYVALEGKLWRTLGWLIAKPGALTVEFIAGRRGRFIDPLRLLLTISLLVFLVMRWEVYRMPHHVAEVQAAQAQSVAAPATVAQAEHRFDRQLFPVFSWVSPNFALNYGKYMALPEPARLARFWDAWLRSGPTVMLCAIPLLAALLKLLHLGTGWRYGEHLVFTMHLQTVSLMVMTVFVGGTSNVVKATLFAAMALYILLGMRKVYGGGWVPLLLRVAIFGYCITWVIEWLARVAFLLRFA